MTTRNLAPAFTETPTGGPGLSIMIPNFNYGRYIGETIASALAEAGDGVEVVVCDNASTDESVVVVNGIRDPRVRLSVNTCNIGFAANLERVASLARGHRMLLLSSDDRMAPGALPAYAKLNAALGERADRAVWAAGSYVIDSHGTRTGEIKADARLWRDATAEPELSAAVGLPVRSMPAAELLKRLLLAMRTPLLFMSTCYPRALHDKVGGYIGGRLMNPDKWFAWKLLSVTETVYFIDAPLFEYRVHGAGQNAQERASGALKHLTDQYVASFNIAPEVLKAAGVTHEQLAAAFIEEDIALRGLVAVSAGERTGARRMLHLGAAAYPALMRRNPKVWALKTLLVFGPLGTVAARAMRKRAEAAWRQGVES